MGGIKMFRCILLLITMSVLFSPVVSASSLSWSEVIRKQEDYVKLLQHDPGFITNTPLGIIINPYFNNLALTGMAANPDNQLIIKSWAKWYIAHLNKPDKLGVTGSIYDYRFRWPDEVVSTDDYDSSDSYAATFITLMRHYYDTNKDLEFMRAIENDLRLIVKAIYGTMDSRDKLTYAKQNYRIKYLMDNAEVLCGLENWAYLLEQVFDKPEEAKKIRNDASICKESLQKMWNGQSFAYAKDEVGKLFTSNTATFYPDMMAQLIAIIYDLTTPEQTTIIWHDFNQRYPKWVRLNHGNSFPDTLMVYAAAKVGDWEKVITYIESIEMTYGESNYNWPWHAGESGMYLLSLRQLLEHEAK